MKAQEAHGPHRWVGCSEQHWPPGLTYPEYSAQRRLLISLRRYHYQGSSWVKACQVCLATLFSPTQEQFSGRSRVWGRRGVSTSGAIGTACSSPALGPRVPQDTLPSLCPGTMGLCPVPFEVTIPPRPASQRKLVL